MNRAAVFRKKGLHMVNGTEEDSPTLLDQSVMFFYIRQCWKKYYRVEEQKFTILTKLKGLLNTSDNCKQAWKNRPNGKLLARKFCDLEEKIRNTCGKPSHTGGKFQVACREINIFFPALTQPMLFWAFWKRCEEIYN